MYRYTCIDNIENYKNNILIGEILNNHITQQYAQKYIYIRYKKKQWSLHFNNKT